MARRSAREQAAMARVARAAIMINIIINHFHFHRHHFIIIIYFHYHAIHFLFFFHFHHAIYLFIIDIYYII